MEGNSTCMDPYLKCCQETFMTQCLVNCTDGVEDKFFDSISGQLWRVEAMLLLNAILAGVIVGIGAYGHRYRPYGFTRYLLLGATTLFLPIISYILSAFGSVGNLFDVIIDSELIAECWADFTHTYMVIVSTCLILISAINTSPIVATDDREDRSIRPPFKLLVQGIWIVYLAQKFFALGRNPRLIVGYMQQLREESDQQASEEDVLPPAPLVVMGEDEHKLEKWLHVRKELGGVWQLDNLFLKDICLSFALFKLLRCRFARYKFTDVISTKTFKFARSILLKDGEHERAFRMMADELSFLHDYYDSPLLVSYSDRGPRSAPSSNTVNNFFGNLYFGIVPALLLLVFVVVVEARDVAYHICSNWTKLPPVIPKWADRLLECRCDWLLRHWNDKMRQSSLLVLHPRQIHQLVLPSCLLRLLDRKSNNVKVPSEMKACIINALRSTSGSNGAGLSKGTTFLGQSQAGRSLLWACSNIKGTSDTILVWHIATTILEARHPHHQQDDPPQQTLQGGRSSSVSEKKTAATHLSHYCVYLVESCPELLPDDDAWSKDLYKKVKKDTNRALTTGGGIAVSSLTPEAVLKDAAKLAEQLRELAGGEEMAWELLVGFWSELILYLAPSDNLKGHLQAIDRGGELITLLWALLTHIGIIDRPGNAAASAPATGV
ncbi:hypothetical protein VPH35_112823 [Triticum aestivum]